MNIKALTIPFFWLCLIATALSGCAQTTVSPQFSTPDVARARDANIALGSEFLKKDDRASARKKFQKALSIDPNAAGAYTGLALIYERGGENKHAQQYYEKAISADRTYTQAYLQYGLFLRKNGDFKKAQKMLEKGASDTFYSNRHVILLYLGRVEMQMGETDAAIAHLKLAANINPRFSIPYVDLASYYASVKNWPEAKRQMSYFERTGHHTAESLLVAIRIERAFGNHSKEQAYAAELMDEFPYSDALIMYRNEVKND